MSFSFELADPADDAALRELLRKNAVPGRVTVTYEREPSFFAGLPALGPFCQVLVARDRETRAIGGFACRAVRRRFVNGHPMDVGTLGLLRVDERQRGRWLVPGGFRFLSELHRDGRAPFYLTTLVEGNEQAKALLVNKPRRSMPRYRLLTRVLTRAVLVTRRARWPEDVSRGTPERLPEILEFLGRVGSERQFFPVLTLDDFGPQGSLPGLRAEDFLLVTREGRLVGAAALWDQSATQQTIVRAYGTDLRVARPVVNAWQRVRGAPKLPAIGEPVRYATLSFIAVEHGDPHYFASLLWAALTAAKDAGLAYVTMGQTEADPLGKVIARRQHVLYPSDLYGVSWPGEPGPDVLDARRLHVEISML